MIAVVASHSVFPTQEVMALVITLLVSHEDEVVIVRCDSQGNINSPVEAAIATVSPQMGKDVLKMPPPKPGGPWERDRRIASIADHVIAFFGEDSVMQGGTGNLVRLALEEKGPSVEAYEVEAGVPHLVGQDNQAAGVTYSRWNRTLETMWREAHESPL